MQRGDILIAVDNNEVTGLSHSDVIHFMSTAARNGIVKLTLRREGFPSTKDNISRANSNSTCKYTETSGVVDFYISNSVKFSDHSDRSGEPDRSTNNGSDHIELASARENIILVRNESEGFGFVIMSSPR